MRKYILFIFILSAHLYVCGQNAAYDQFTADYNRLRQEGDNDSALILARQMSNWALENETDTSLRYAVSLRYVGNCFNALQLPDSALHYWQNSLAVLVKQNRQNHPDYASSLNNLGVLYHDMRDYKSAEPYYKEALAIRKKALGEDHPDYASSLNKLGNLYGDMWDYKSAEQYYKEALAIIKKGLREEHPYYVMSLHNFGVMYIKMGLYKSAEPYYKEVLAIRKKALGGNHPDYVESLNGLGNLYETMGDYKSAETYYKEALAISKKALGEEHPDYDWSFTNLGILYKKMGDYKSAEPYYKEVLAIKKKALGEEHPDYAWSFTNLGGLYETMGDYKSAEQYFKEAFAIRKKALGEEHPDYASRINSYLKGLGILYKTMGDYKSAEPYYKELLAIRKKAFGEEHPAYAWSLNNLGILYYDMGDYKTADSLFHLEFPIRVSGLSTNFSWLSAKEKEAYWQQEEPFFNRLNTFAGNTSMAYPPSTVLSFNAGLISKSLLLESSRELATAIAQSKDETLKLNFSEMIQLRRLYQKMQSEGSDQRELMARYLKQADSLDKILVLSLGVYAESKRKFETTWKDVQSGLSPSEVAIEFGRYFDKADSLNRYMALLVKPGYEYPQLVKLGNEKSIQNARQDMDFSTLYNLVWRDLDTLLNGVQTIYYSPAGELNNVSFAALCYQAGDSTLASSENQRNVIWEEQKTKTQECQGLLLDKYKLHQLTSTRYLADGTLQRANAMTSTIALYGGIHYDDLPEKVTRADVHKSNEDVAFQLNLAQYKKQNPQNDPRASVRSSSAYGKKMKYLEGTKTEVENIALVTKNKQWKVHTSTALNASEHALKEDLNREMPGVLHIATHGFAFPDLAKRESDMRDLEGNTRYKVSEDPMFRCGLMLSGSNISWTGGAETMIEQTGEDGILTAAEVANLNLTGTKLVVLSACETGLGKIEGTEGTFGLKRGFKLAGVEQIMVSLWSVPDAQTMELMTLFYTDLASTMDPVESFEKAQKEMKQRYPTEPEKWAGFVLVR